MLNHYLKCVFVLAQPTATSASRLWGEVGEKRCEKYKRYPTAGAVCVTNSAKDQFRGILVYSPLGWSKVIELRSRESPLLHP